MSKTPDDKQPIFGTIGPVGTNIPPPHPADLQEQIVEGLRNVASIDERYTDIEPINHGGMGQVFKAKDRNLQRTVAIKQMLVSSIDHQDAIKRFLRESQIAGGLNHPHIITVYHSGMTRLGPYLVMEYAAGGDLGSLCQKGASDPITVIEYGIQICKALKRTHEEGIIHRDIKPQNILLQLHDPSEPMVAKLADFGLAWGGNQSLVSQANMQAGTAYYRSPEQTLGGAKIDARSDIYSLGATLYHLLSGVPPIQLRMERIPESTRNLISRSTEWDAEARYASAKEMQQALETCRSGIEHASLGRVTGESTNHQAIQARVVEPRVVEPKEVPESLKAQTSLPEKFTNSLGMKFRLIPAGKFLMGSPRNEKGRFKNELQHEVILTKPYYLGVYPVSQGEYERVMGCNPSYFKGDRHPVEKVSWEDAMAYIERLNSLAEEMSLGRRYRLPTESEWEHACRAGSRTAYCYGDEDSRLGDYAWYASNSESRTHPVGETESNAWGLQDMHGNVWEWCSDWYGDYPNAEVTDSTGPTSGSNRVFRGGCWFSGTSYCRSAFRGWDAPSCRYNDLGFRLALSS
jgi:formylglycine-generating enzyme required for sulfatase activity/tRNA A-37 threonylcarbamoyl transferase component Bud32